MATTEEIESIVKDFAADLSGALPDPAGWGIWLSLLLEELEAKAAESGQPLERYDLALQLIENAARERRESHQR